MERNSKIINGGHGELKLHEKIRLFDNDLPIEHVFKIPSITIVIKSLIEKNNRFYLELSLTIVCTKLNKILILIKNMLEYDKIDISEGIDTNKNILTSKECYLCGYWYFINKNFNYQKYMCNGCHDISTKTISMYNLCIGYNNGNAYRNNFAFMSKNDALNLI